jgi:hypothetical protein
MAAHHHYTKPLLIFVGLLTFVMGILLFLHPPAIFPDPSWGFQVMRGMQNGGKFNLLPQPNVNNIAQNSPVFLSWWSPGQYLAPYALISLFKLNMGQGAAIVVFLCSLSGLTGLYVFFNKIGFTPFLSAVSVAFIACQQAYAIPYCYYNGGEILLFGFAGWFLYGCSYFKRISLWMALFLLLAGLIGFFCKSSFLWIYISGALYLWITISSGQKIIKWLVNGFFIGVPVVVSLAIIYVCYLSKGENPAASALGLKFTLEAFSFPLASPLLAGLSVDDISNGIINRPLIVLVLTALISLVLLVCICKLVPHKQYRLMLLLFYGVSVLFYTTNFLRQASISYEARHMRLIGLLVTPGLIYLVGNLKIPYRIIFGLVWAFIAWKSSQFVFLGYKMHKDYAAHGSSGFAQEFIDQPALDYITQLDKRENKAIFVFISPDVPLEITYNRTITFEPLDDKLKPENDLDIYEGHAGPVFIVLPTSYIGPKAAVYIKNFPGYRNFTFCAADKNYVVYSAR